MNVDALQLHSLRSGYEQIKMVKDEDPPSKLRLICCFGFTGCITYHSDNVCFHFSFRRVDFMCVKLCFLTFSAVLSPQFKDQQGKIGGTSFCKNYRMSPYEADVFAHVRVHLNSYGSPHKGVLFFYEAH